MADGEWKSLGSLAFDAIVVIRPEIAWRWYAAAEERRAKHQGREPRTYSLDEQISRGRMGMIAEALRQMGAEERNHQAGTQRQFRLTNLRPRRSTGTEISGPRERLAMSFDGHTYEPEWDEERLGRQLRRVKALMRDGEWRTLGEIAIQTGDPESSISARLRDLRKPKFGECQVLRQRRADPKQGLFEYRLVVPQAQERTG